jgi:hypothetical protein
MKIKTLNRNKKIPSIILPPLFDCCYFSTSCMLYFGKGRFDSSLPSAIFLSLSYGRQFSDSHCSIWNKLFKNSIILFSSLFLKIKNNFSPSQVKKRVKIGFFAWGGEFFVNELQYTIIAYIYGKSKQLG